MAHISYKQSIDCTTQSIFFVRLHSSNNEGLARTGHLLSSLNIGKALACLLLLTSLLSLKSVQL